MWDDIIGKCGDAIYGTLASRAFEMLDYVETFRIPPDEITSEDWDYMQAARQVRRNLEMARAVQAREAQLHAERAAHGE